ncbi:hypothetical protein HAX54_040722, partial [Datura stramonium]|nr:hypothetical protein [Datura stramonium]
MGSGDFSGPEPGRHADGMPDHSKITFKPPSDPQARPLMNSDSHSATKTPLPHFYNFCMNTGTWSLRNPRRKPP